MSNVWKSNRAEGSCFHFQARPEGVSGGPIGTGRENYLEKRLEGPPARSCGLLWTDSASLQGHGGEGGGEGIALKPSQKPRRQKGTQQTAGAQSRVQAVGERNLQERREDAQDHEFTGEGKQTTMRCLCRDVTEMLPLDEHLKRSKGNLPKRQSLPYEDAGEQTGDFGKMEGC